MIEPIRPIPLADIEAARGRFAGTVLRTPLVRLDTGPGGPDIRLKLENLQPTNAYKIRGAANAVARLSGAERARGVWTVSAGNAGQAVAFAARCYELTQFLVEVAKLDTIDTAFKANAAYHDSCSSLREADHVTATQRNGNSLFLDRGRLRIPRVSNRCKNLLTEPETVEGD